MQAASVEAVDANKLRGTGRARAVPLLAGQLSKSLLAGCSPLVPGELWPVLLNQRSADDGAWEPSRAWSAPCGSSPTGIAAATRACMS
jgi:hypothetical protein